MTKAHTQPPEPRFVTNAHKAGKSRERRERPADGSNLAIWGTVARITAVGFWPLILTAFVIYTWSHRNFMPGHWYTDRGLIENLLAGSVFFWIELLIVLLLLPLLANLSAERSNRLIVNAQLRSIHFRLAEIMNKIDDERYNFAIKLDKSKTSENLYDSSLADVEICIKEIREKLSTRDLSDPTLHMESRNTILEILRILDEMIDGTYQAVEDALRATKAKDATKLDEALTRLFDECDCEREGGLAEIYRRLFDLHA